MLPTPIYDLKQYPNVYDPSEDTFLFLDALEKEQTFLLELKPLTAVEIGSGSGVLISGLSSILKNTCAYFATDINISACEATHNTAKLNDVNINSTNMDLLSGFRPKIFDIILFNPPYVVTEECETIGNGLNRAWAGGEAGRLIINKLLDNLSELLSPNGVCYMVLLKENKPDDIVNILYKQNIKGEMVMERKIPGEHLFVYKFCRILKL